MITKNRCVLAYVNSKNNGQRITRYEAVEVIDDLKKVPEVWKKNKTPAMDKELLTGEVSYPVVDIPESVLEDFDTDIFIEFCHVNGVESGEFITGEVYNTEDDDCFLCRIGNLEGSNRPLWVYNKDVVKEANVIIYESPHFFVVPEYGSIMRGFLMICPKEHILSMANLPDGYFAEYYQVEKDVEYILKSTYGFDRPVSFFEHGSDPNGRSSHKRSVVHAHTHVVWGFELGQKYMDMVCMKEIEDIRQAREGKYFSYRKNADGKVYMVNDPEVYVQRQYPRQIMADMLGLAPGQYNWRKEGFEENVTATLYRIFCFLSDNKMCLPERIQNNVKGFIVGYQRRDSFRRA